MAKNNGSRKPKRGGSRQPKPVPTGKGNKEKRETEEILDTAGKMYTSQSNPFAWYNAYPLLTEYAGTVPFGIPLGASINLKTPESTATGLDAQVISGIMRLDFIPTIGYSTDNSSPINRAAINWYTFWRQAQKASADYEHADMMIGYVAIDSLFMYHKMLQRIIGVANLRTPLNLYTIDAIMQSLGVSPSDVRTNIDRLWGYVNQLAVDLKTIAMPKDIDFRYRHEWMCSGIYTDGDQVRSQMYIFNPIGFWKYDNTAETGSQLQFVFSPTYTTQPATVSATVQQLIDFGESLKVAIFGDSDIATISGDVLNALGSANIAQADMTDRFYQVVPAYSQTVLSQIENSTALGQIANPASLTISQDPAVNSGAIIFKPTFTGYNSAAGKTKQHKHYLNFHHEKPSVDDVIEATRLTVMFNGKYNQDGSYEPTAFGSEIITQYSIWTLIPGQQPKSIIVGNRYFSNEIMFDTQQSYKDLGDYVTLISAISTFDWHPTIYTFLYDSANTALAPNCRGALADLDVTGVIDDLQLQEMHYAALTSLFRLPQVD